MPPQKPKQPAPGAEAVVGMVDDLLHEAIAAGASDVHFEPTRGDLHVRYRLDGVLQTVRTVPRGLAENVVARLKVLAGLLTYRTNIPQEGRLELPDPTGRVLDQRLAVLPTVHGQRAVVRLFYEEGSLQDLADLGLAEGIAAELRRIAEGNQGVLLVTGPAGSGKSTTLAALLRHVLRRFPGKSVLAVEDPVERYIDGVTQVQIDPYGEMNFPAALRSLLRQDPQVLMIGEIRDAQTARIAVQAGLTGHLLMTTLHAGTPAAALLRLLEMGVEPYQVTSAVVGVLNQRLLRRVCRRCAAAATRTGEPAGCRTCFGTGYRGRALVAELVCLDGELRRALLDKADLDALQASLRRRGHMTLRQDAARLVGAGVTTEEEVAAVLGPDRE